MIHAKPLEEPESVTDVVEFLSRLEGMQDGYAWASDTLDGIYTTVTETGRVTAGQVRAIDNIEEGGRRHGRSW